MAGILDHHARLLATGLEEVHRRTKGGLLKVYANWDEKSEEIAMKEEKIKGEIHKIEQEILILEEEQNRLKYSDQNSTSEELERIKRALDTQSSQHFLEINQKAKFVDGTSTMITGKTHDNKFLPVAIESESIDQLSTMINILSQLTGIIILDHQRGNSLWELKGKTTTGGLAFTAHMEVHDDLVSSLQITVPKDIEEELETILDSAQINRDLPLFLSTYGNFAELYDARQNLFEELYLQYSPYVRREGLQTLRIEPERGVEGLLSWKAKFEPGGNLVPVINFEIIIPSNHSQADLRLCSEAQRHFSRLVKIYGLRSTANMFIDIICKK